MSEALSLFTEPTAGWMRMWNGRGAGAENRTRAILPGWFDTVINVNEFTHRAAEAERAVHHGRHRGRIFDVLRDHIEDNLDALQNAG
jgi:hypothetical protein